MSAISDASTYMEIPVTSMEVSLGVPGTGMIFGTSSRIMFYSVSCMRLLYSSASSGSKNLFSSKSMSILPSLVTFMTTGLRIDSLKASSYSDDKGLSYLGLKFGTNVY